MVGIKLTSAELAKGTIRSGQAMLSRSRICFFTTGQFQAQHDTIPLNWTYPTNAWEPGEIVRDNIQLDTAGLPAEDFELWIGLYGELSGERLLTEAGEERIFLTTISN